MKILTIIVLLVTTPSLLLYPNEQTFKTFERDQLPIYYFSSFDTFMHLIDEVEKGNFEEHCTLKELKNVRQLFASLVREGFFNGDNIPELESDVEELLAEEIAYQYLSSTENEYLILPSIYFYDREVYLCKKRWWKKTKKFLKKYKKELIIGGVIVLAAATVTLTAASAGAAVAAANATTSSNKHKKKESDTTNKKLSANETPLLKEAIGEHVDSFKVSISKDFSYQEVSNLSQDPKLKEKVRDVSATLAHEMLNGIYQLVQFVPQLLDEVKQVGVHLAPDTVEDNQLFGSPTENFDDLLSKGHLAIDQVFATDQAKSWIANRQEIADLTFAMAPPPNGLPKIFSNTNILVKNGKVIDKGGFTKAGRSLMKHGYRQNSVFPKPVGTPEQINAHGQKILESILNHPEKQVVQRQVKKFGKVIDIRVPKIGGVRYNAAGDMIGFLEP